MITAIVTGCALNSSNSMPPLEVAITSFSADKPSYSSNQPIVFSIEIVSNAAVSGAELRIIGINPNTRAYIDAAQVFDLNAGINRLTVPVKAPPCTSGCSGIRPGSYVIQAFLSANSSELAIANTTISLVSG